MSAQIAECQRVSSELAWTIGRAIRAERSRADVTQEQLAEAIGVSRPTVAAMELGNRRLYADEIPDLCRALGITIDDLFRKASDDDRRAIGL